jgi:hypothetical protein
MLHCTALHCTALLCTALHRTAISCTALRLAGNVGAELAVISALFPLFADKHTAPHTTLHTADRFDDPSNF